jgi:hypothetical protein
MLSKNNPEIVVARLAQSVEHETLKNNPEIEGKGIWDSDNVHFLCFPYSLILDSCLIYLLTLLLILI